jgi:DNA topoisomerase-1
MIRELRVLSTANQRLELAKEESDWWGSMSAEQQEQYLTEHPNSQKAKEAREKEGKPAPVEDHPSKDREHPVVQVSVGTKMVDGKRVQADGKPLPDHIQKLGLPPAWSDVKFNPEPDGALLAQGKDAKGRVQSVYSEAFSKTQAEAKFRRIEELHEKFDEIKTQNAKNQKSKDPKVKASADCLAMIMAMGIRPGSDDDTKAKVKAFGATMLQSNHLVKTKDGLFLKFVGKDGVNLNLPVTDPALAKMLVARAKEAGPEGRLFDTNAGRLLDYTHTLDGGGFKVKDFRTNLGCKTAMEEIGKMPVPTNEKEYKAAVRAVAVKVSSILGNTPTIALQSYIAPELFSEWKMASAGGQK